MILELITPLMLTTAPMQIDLPEIRYNHITQQSIQMAANKTLTSYSGTNTGMPVVGGYQDQDLD